MMEISKKRIIFARLHQYKNHAARKVTKFLTWLESKI